MNETWDALTAATYAYVVPTVVVAFATLWLRAARWKYLLHPLARTKTAGLYPIVTVGYMANNVLPMRAGEIVRAYLTGKRYGISRMGVLATIAVERMFDGIILVGFFVVFGPIVGLNDTLRNLAVLMGAIFAVVVVGFFAVAWSEERSARFARRVLNLLPSRIRQRAGDWAESFLTGLRALRSRSTLIYVMVLSVLIWVGEATGYYLMGRAFSIDERFAVYMVVVAAANLAITVPSSQGGIGPFEFFARETLVATGVGSGVATAYALALHAVLLVPVVVAGLVFIWLTDITLAGALGSEPGERDLHPDRQPVAGPAPVGPDGKR